MREKLKGVVVPAVTPLNSDHTLDEPGFERLIEFLLGERVHGIFANGSMGGFALMTDREQFRTIEAAVRIVGGRVPVLAGVSETSTARVLEKLRVIKPLDVNAVVVITPYFYIMRQDEMRRFFLSVADASHKPVVLYDNSRMTNNPLEVETVVALARHENVCGLKISAPDAFTWQELLRAELPRERFSLFAGAEKMMGLPLQLGFDGITGGLHNIVPNLAVQLYDTIKRGDFAAGELLQQGINRAHKIFEIDGGWRGAETALRYMGICRKITAEMYEVGIPQAKLESIMHVLEAEQILRPYAALSAVT